MTQRKLAADQTFFGHPKGLGFIVFTEVWERFSFYGMQGLLILYMSGYLFVGDNPDSVIGYQAFVSWMTAVFGDLSPQAMATQAFGLYVGLVYLLPVFGGLVGDRLTGRTKAVVIGAVLMAIGHFLMALEAYFLFALLFLILGSGFLKGNLAAQVGELYPKSDQRRDSAYTFYSISITVGAFFAPLVCGTLGEVYGWHYGFSAAGIAMLVATAIYLGGVRHFSESRGNKQLAKGDETLTRSDKLAIVGVLCVVGIASVFWIGQTQVWNAYPLWVQDRVDREVFGWQIPVTWFQSIDVFAVIAVAPLLMWFWRRQNKRNSEPSELRKIAIGCAIFAIACLALAASEWLPSPGQIPMAWPVLFHFLVAFGFLYASPVTLSLISRTAPESVNSMMVGCYYLSIFVGGIASGWLAGFYESMDNATFWAMHAVVAFSGSVLILVFGRGLGRLLAIDTNNLQSEANE